MDGRFDDLRYGSRRFDALQEVMFRKHFQLTYSILPSILEFVFSLPPQQPSSFLKSLTYGYG